MASSEVQQRPPQSSTEKPALTEFVVLRGAQSADAFRNRTFPAFRDLLDFCPDRPLPIAVGAIAGGEVAGLGLACSSSDKPRAELLSFYVEPARRGRGIATELLARLEDECVARGLFTVAGTYMSGQPTTPAVERVLAKRGFDAHQVRMLVVKCSLESVKPAPWMRDHKLPPGYEIVPWLEVSTAEREEIRASHAREPWVAPDLVPFDFERGIEPVTSVALRVRGRIAGWCLNHAVGDVLRFTCSYVRPDLQRLGRVLWLYREAVARMPRAGFTVGMWTVPVEHAGMARFARRWMQPYAVFFGETRGVEKRLEASRDQTG